MNDRPKMTDQIEQMREALRPMVGAMQAIAENLRHFKVNPAPMRTTTDDPESDRIPAILSPARSTHRRPGETHAEAMERLTQGEDL